MPSLLQAPLEILAARRKRFQAKNTSRTALAAHCCISTVYLNKLFHKELGETPFSYITRRRMEIACEMLREHCAVGEVARLVGYGEIYQFSRAFKKHYGISPRAFMGGAL